MDKSYSGLYIILFLGALYLVGIYLPEKEPEPLPRIPPPPVENRENVVGYDYKNQTYIYAQPIESDKIDLGLGDIPINKKTEVIYIEKDKPMAKKEFEYMVEDYIHDNWDDLRDKFDN